jgi:hypothetical protein
MLVFKQLFMFLERAVPFKKGKIKTMALAGERYGD